MTSDLTEAKSPPAASNEDAEALLETANSASQHVAVLHVAFMALCAYVLVIVFGTSDMDLLIGKGVKLPVVDMDRGDSRCGYLRRLVSRRQRWRMAVAWAAGWVGVVAPGFATT
ncbi:MAG: hypothetical protein ACREYC_28475, partial [Gammaproteobacteria bacterium]